MAAIPANRVTCPGNTAAPWLTPWTTAVALLAVSVGALWPTWEALHGFWVESSRYSHGYLIAAISAYMLYRLRPAVERTPASFSLLGLAGLLLLLAVWAVAVLGSIQAAHQILLPAILWTACLAALGWRVALRLVLPLGYLYLAVPIWESGNFVLQYLTVQVVGAALAIVDIPVFISGNFVRLPAGSFEVAEGCSGLHYLIISFSIAVLYAWLYLDGIRKSLLLVGIVVFVALLTNWLRVFTVIVAGHVTDMQHFLVTQDHYYFGWVLYGIAMTPALWFARRLESGETDSEDRRPAGSGERRAAPVFIGPFVLAVLCLGAASGVIYAKMPADDGLSAQLELPASRGGWQRLGVAPGDWRPHFSGAHAEALADYGASTGTVSYYSNLYVAQSQGKEVIGLHNRIEGNDGGWYLQRAGQTQIDLGGSQVLALREARLIGRAGEQRLVYFRYRVGDRPFVSALAAKLYYGVAVLSGRPDAGIDIVSVRCQATCDRARGALREWLAAYTENGRFVTSRLSNNR